MSQDMEQYLSGVRMRMFGMPRKARNGIIQELRVHILDTANARGGPGVIGQVVSEMDPPRTTARMYRQVYGYGTFFRILFTVIAIFLAIWTVPIWEIVFPSFSTTFVFLLLIIFLFFVGSAAGKMVGLAAGIAALITRFVVLGLITAAAGEHGIITGGGVFVFLLSSILLVVIAYLPGRTVEKWRETRLWDMPTEHAPQPYTAPFPGNPVPTPYTAQPMPSPQGNYNAQTIVPPSPPPPGSQARRCPSCKKDIPISSKFCLECGTQIV